MNKSRTWCALSLAACVIASLACSLISPRPGPETPPAAGIHIPATAAPAAPSPAADRSELHLLDRQSLIQNGTSAAAVFFVQNPHDRLAVETSEYEVTALDADGKELGRASSTIGLVLPGETLAVTAGLEVSTNNAIIASFQVHLTPGEQVDLGVKTPIFAVLQAQYLPDEYSPRITGIIRSEIDAPLKDVYLTALAYDAAGNLTGAINTWISFLNAHEETAVDFPQLYTSGETASVELYPSLGGSTSIVLSPSQEAPVVLLKQGFVQGADLTGVIFTLRNESGAQALERTLYRASAYDAQGIVLASIEGFIPFLQPGETTAAFEHLFVSPGAQIDRVGIQIQPGSPVEPRSDLPMLAFSQPALLSDDGDVHLATAAARNDTGRSILDVKMVAVLEDSQGEITGGGAAYQSFFPPGESGIALSVFLKGEPAKIEFFPVLQPFTILRDSAPELKLVRSGFGTQLASLGVGFLIQNEDPTLALSDSYYLVTVLDASGRVIGAEGGQLPLIFPGEILGIASSLYIPGGPQASQVKISLMGGTLIESPLPQSPLRAGTVIEIGDEFYAAASGEISSGLGSEITDVVVDAIAFDSAGNIIGGGPGYLDRLPANGSALVKVFLVSDGKPARVEFYPRLSPMSQYLP